MSDKEEYELFSRTVAPETGKGIFVHAVRHVRTLKQMHDRACFDCNDVALQGAMHAAL